MSAARGTGASPATVASIIECHSAPDGPPAGGHLQSTTVIARYSRPEMARVWSDEMKLGRWLEVELAALDGWAAVGVPAEAGAAVREGARVPSPGEVAARERETGHDVAAFIDVVAAGLGAEGRWLHYGLTSSDVLDTALSLTVRDAGALVLAGLDSAFARWCGARTSIGSRSAWVARTASTLSRRPSG